MGAALWVVEIFHRFYCFPLVPDLKYEWVNKIQFPFSKTTYSVCLFFLSLPHINMFSTFLCVFITSYNFT